MLIRLTRMCWTLMINDKKEAIIKILIEFKTDLDWVFLDQVKGVMPINGTIKC